MRLFLKDPLKRLVLALYILLFCCCYGLSAFAENDPLNKYKAAFIYSFLKYIQADQDRSTICIAGDTELFDLIKTKPNTKYIDISAAELKSCALVYVSKRNSDKVAEVIDTVDGSQIITVSDSANFINKGGIIEVYEDGGKLKFALNLKKATALKFNVNSKLVEIADKTI